MINFDDRVPRIYRRRFKNLNSKSEYRKVSHKWKKYYRRAEKRSSKLQSNLFTTTWKSGAKLWIDEISKFTILHLFQHRGSGQLLFQKKKKNAVGKLSILEPCNKQANQDGRVVNFDRVVLVDGRVILVRIMRGIQLDGHHFIDFHYRIWSGRGIDEQASRYRSTRQDLDHYNEGSAFHPPLPPSLK